MNPWKGLKKIIWTPIKKKLFVSLGFPELHARLDRIEKHLDLLHSLAEYWERSRQRWRASIPDAGLTWGMEISGDPFIHALQKYVAFDAHKKILEIGPGYGRLIKSCLHLNLPFLKYMTLDISVKTSEFLKTTFPDPRFEFLNGDVERYVFTDRFDILFSSLTFKHLYPTFQNALVNLSECMNPGAVIAFDLLVGDRAVFEADGVTYVRAYQPDEILDILRAIPLEWVAFEPVEHAPGMTRLLVVAKK